MSKEKISSLANGTSAGSKTSNANVGILKRSLRKKAKDKYWLYKPKDALDGSMNPNNPPQEGYYFEYHVMAWVPESFDVEAYDQEKNACIEAEYQRLLDTTPNPNNPEVSLSGKPLIADNKETSPIEKKDHLEQVATTPSVDQGQRYTSIIVEPTDESSQRQKIRRPFSMVDDKIVATETPSPYSPSPIADERNVEPTIEAPIEAVEQSKKTRRSAKMVEADFDSLAGRFITPTDLKDKKPLFFPEEIREALRKIAGLVPGGKVSPSHIAVHVIEAWIDENRELLNRMFANQKTSI